MATKPATSTERVVSLTCIACRMKFDDAETMRTHYKGDYHRFNLKRKVANLPPVPEHLFNQKVADMQSNAVKEKPKGGDHLKKGKQQKHKKDEHSNEDHKPENEVAETPKATGEASTPVIAPASGEEPKQATEEELIDEKIAAAPRLTLVDSLFDRHQSTDLESNINYMTKNHGFYIPEIEYVKDLSGLITYLGEKISIGNTCLFCEKTFYSMNAVQDHMRALAHCKMWWDDNEDEYADYYDLEALDKRFALPTEADQESENSNVYVSSTNELVLRDKGKVLGHRDLAVYYSQKTSRVSSNMQLVRSLLQEHKRLEAIDKQKKSNYDKKELRKRSDWRTYRSKHYNTMFHFRPDNPL
eukprot:TRINITY_DN10336_c0_g1_i1.p1 TRINITY_DN10336_c0_g1~~TRINITY_DN10336_c0_g1_i1.p1  ORF type:complete len:357 (-),score=83.93 TRINITY_DN10336_c0_g1_i1:214-1284(-)